MNFIKCEECSTITNVEKPMITKSEITLDAIGYKEGEAIEIELVLSADTDSKDARNINLSVKQGCLTFLNLASTDTQELLDAIHTLNNLQRYARER